jgi:hypothetical protein
MTKDPKRVKAGKHSKVKGDSFELKVGKILGEWWGCEFKRSPRSGGSGLYGMCKDLIPQDQELEHKFPFSVECKKQEKWVLGDLFKPIKMSKSKKNPYTCKVWNWWHQACQQADINKKNPLLVFSRNRQPIYVMMDTDITYKNPGRMQNILSVTYFRSNNTCVFLLNDLVKSNTLTWL